MLQTLLCEANFAIIDWGQVYNTLNSFNLLGVV